MMFQMNVIKSRISNTTTINSVKRYLSQSKINDNTVVKETTNLLNKVKTSLTIKVVGGLAAAFIVSLPIAAYGFDYYDQWNINETLIQGQNVEASTDYLKEEILQNYYHLKYHQVTKRKRITTLLVELKALVKLLLLNILQKVDIITKMSIIKVVLFMYLAVEILMILVKLLQMLFHIQQFMNHLYFVYFMFVYLVFFQLWMLLILKKLLMLVE